MSPGDQCFRGHGRRNGERRRKSVRGCIVSQDLSVLNLVIVKKGAGELPGLTDEEKPRQRGPKRASKIRKMFNLTKDDDVRHYVKIYGKKVEKVGGWVTGSRRAIQSMLLCVRLLLVAVMRPSRASLRRSSGKPPPLLLPLQATTAIRLALMLTTPLPPPAPPLPSPRLQNGKTSIKCPKIQRLVTPQVLQRKRHRAAIKKERISRKKTEAADYHKLLMSRLKEQRERRSESLAKKRATRMASVASKEA